MQFFISYTRFSSLLAVCLLLITVSSCRPKPIDIDIDPPEQEIVVASQILPNRIMLISLTRSFSALAVDVDQDSLSNDFLADLLVDSAEVTVSYAGNTDTLFNIGNGVYGSLNTLQLPNEYYTLSVFDSTSQKRVTAQTPMLPLIGFDSLLPIVERTAEDTIIKVDYTFTDPTGDNYYVINVVKRNSDTSSVGIDINSFFSVGLNVITQTELLSDKTFDGPVKSEQLILENVSAEDSIVVTLANISKEYFEYLQASQRSQGLLSQVTQEPINRPSNVNGGYGFFNAYYPDVNIFDLNDY